MDKRQFNTEKVIPGGEEKCSFAELQGSSLVVINDAVFSEKDWKGITSPRISNKKDSVEKVGKFGLGFSSIYHVTGIVNFCTFHTLWTFKK